MPIAFSCECGKKYQVKDEFAGKKTNCQACGKSLLIPSAEGEADLELDQEDLVPPAERNKPKKKELDVNLSEPASNVGLIIGGVAVGVGVIAFVVMLMGFFEGDGHDPYMLANSTPIPGDVVSSGPVKPINPLLINKGDNGKNGDNGGGPKIEQKLREYEGVSNMTISTDGRTLVTNKGSEIVAWDMSSESAIKSLPDGHVCNNLLVDVTNILLLTAGPTSNGGEVRLWNLQSGNVILTVPLKSAIASLGFSNDSTRAFISSEADGTIVIDIPNAKASPPLTNPWSKAKASAFNIAKNQAAFAYSTEAGNPQLEVVDLGSMKVVHTTSTDAADGTVTFSNDGRWLVTASAKTLVHSTSWDGLVALPRTVNGRLRGKVAMSADNRFLAGVSPNGLVVWDLNSKLDRLITSEAILDAVFISDNRLVYSTGKGIIQIVKVVGE